MMRMISLALIPAFLSLSGAAVPAQEAAERSAGGRTQQPAASVGDAQDKSTAPQGPQRPSTHDENKAASQHKPVVLQLQNADCHEMANLIEQTFGLNAMPVPRMNAVICNCSPEDLSEIRELLAQVDVTVSEGEDQEFAILPVQQRRVDEIADAVSSLLAGKASSVRIAKDRGRSAMVVRGTRAAIEKVRALVQQLDQPAGCVNLEFAFFRADVNRPDAPVKVPPDLAPVAEELRRFGAVELAGRLSTVAGEGEKFIVVGAIAETMPRVQVRGELVASSTEGVVKLRVIAHLILETRTTPPPRAGADEPGGQAASRPSGRPPEFELETSVQTKRGDYVVLGSAPAGSATGESIILVLHVRE